MSQTSDGRVGTGNPKTALLNSFNVRPLSPYTTFL